MSANPEAVAELRKAFRRHGLLLGAEETAVAEGLASAITKIVTSSVEADRRRIADLIEAEFSSPESGGNLPGVYRTVAKLARELRGEGG